MQVYACTNIYASIHLRKYYLEFLLISFTVIPLLIVKYQDI